jgi:GalNAc-alpha-(1->4)-GalNAc-alpha-(1->3)-diNAcBac-PP-undecaprenol alpha-1,4-N-acetyl-D-galactosaminyltransferase
MNKLNQKKITIGLVLPYLNSRGPDRQALHLTKAFIEKGADVVVFVVQGWGLEEMYQGFRESGATVVNMGSPDKKGVKKVSLWSFLPLAILAKKYRCNVLLSRAGRTNRVCGMAGLMTFIPAILVLVIAPTQMISPYFSFFKRFAPHIHLLRNFGHPTFVVSVSGDILANFLETYPFMSGRAKTIRNGVDIYADKNNADSPLALDRRKFNICFSGSIKIERKGLDVLLNALKYLVFDLGLNHAQLVLIGAGKDEPKIKEMVKTSGLDDYVVFAGEQFNPSSIIKQSDVFVLPSRVEGFPNSLLEAMSQGICCISTDCKTGPKEIIENGKNGILVPVEDSREIAEAIVRLEKDSGLRQELAANGLRTIREKFSYRKMADAYYELIMEVI